MTSYSAPIITTFTNLYYGNSWHRSRHHSGPWVEIPYRQLPPGIRKHRIEQIRSHRDREYRVYLRERDHYRGRSFRPKHERKEELKDERRHDREEMKDDRRRDKEERKEEKQDRKREKHGRD
jgi:hypothetical protein